MCHKLFPEPASRNNLYKIHPSSKNSKILQRETRHNNGQLHRRKFIENQIFFMGKKFVQTIRYNITQ